MRSADGLFDAVQRGVACVQLAGKTLQGEELAERIGGVANAVSGAARVGVVVSASVESLVAVAGVILSGGSAVPISSTASSQERDHIVRDSGVEMVLEASDYGRRAPPDSPAADCAAALVLYTSGSTGPPKGVVLSRSNIAYNIDALSRIWEWSDRDILSHALPLSHVHGLVFGGLGPLQIGSALVHTGRCLSPVEDATIYFGVPALWSSVKDGDLRAMRRARLLISGAGALTRGLFQRVESLTGNRILNRYAMTETLVITSPSLEEERAPPNVGKPLPGTEVRLLEADDSGIGTIEVRGAGVFRGYQGETSPALRDGWFDTGDMGKWNASGGLDLLGRRNTDLIKTGGYRVGAGEVEEVLLAFPGISEAAVVGIPHPILGQCIVAWVTCNDDLDHRKLREHLSHSLSAYKHPAEINVVKSLPRNLLGKLQKHRLASERRSMEDVC